MIHFHPFHSKNSIIHINLLFTQKKKNEKAIQKKYSLIIPVFSPYFPPPKSTKANKTVSTLNFLSFNNCERVDILAPSFPKSQSIPNQKTTHTITKVPFSLAIFLSFPYKTSQLGLPSKVLKVPLLPSSPRLSLNKY